MKLKFKQLKIGNLIITTKKYLNAAIIDIDHKEFKHIDDAIKTYSDLRIKSPEELLRDGMITHTDYVWLKKQEKYKDGRRI